MHIRELKGVGPKTGSLLENLGIESVEDLLLDFPCSYQDRRRLYNIEDLKEDGTYVIKCRIDKIYRPIRLRGGKTMLRIQASDDSGSINIIYFNQAYLSRNLPSGDFFFFYGPYKHDKKAIYSPIFERGDSSDFLRIIPKYRLTKGLSNNKRIKMIKEALALLKKEEENKLNKIDNKTEQINIIDDKIPFEWRGFFGQEKDIVFSMHFPSSHHDYCQALKYLRRRRALTYILLDRERKTNRNKLEAQHIKWIDPGTFLDKLKFKLTKGQVDAFKSISKKLYDNSAMSLLLQGDVGSGKTVIAFLAAYIVLKNGYSVAMMAPTEVLASQHYKKAAEIFTELNLSCILRTGSDSRDKKEKVRKFMKEARPCLYIGTHALFQKDMDFKNLALVITDEQHRFGVLQRKALGDKAIVPNILLMSATPIPRTMSLLAMGDLDLIRLKEMPGGRKEIITRLIKSRSESAIFAGLVREISKGRQVYLVCPAIEDRAGENELDYWSVDAVYERFLAYLKTKNREDIKISKLSGRMKAEEKDKLMEEFYLGKTSALIATTVVEVGLDVANASVMAIFAAERFGLAQLHQLRGRVGRGDEQGYCLLITEKKSGPAIERLKYMEDHSDGWEIAKKDLLNRGGGDKYGTLQHGFDRADILSIDEDLIKEVSNFLDNMLEQDKYENNIR